MNKKNITTLIMLIGFAVFLFSQLKAEKHRDPILISASASMIDKSLDDLIAEADLIVVGEVSKVNPSRWNTLDGELPENVTAKNISTKNIIYTDFDFLVNQYIKGGDESSINIRTFGGRVGQDVITIDSEPILEKKQTYLLFLVKDLVGLTANVGNQHYLLLSSNQDTYKVVDGKATSFRDEQQLEDLVAYIQNSPLLATPLSVFDTPDTKDIIRLIETAYDVEAEAAYSFNTEKFSTVFINNSNHVVVPEKLEFIRFFINDPVLEKAGYLDYKTAYYNWWSDSTSRFEALKEKAKAENREVTQEEINSFIDSKWSMAPARGESPERKNLLRFISIEIINDTATVYLNDGYQLVILYLVRVDGQWYIAGNKELTLSVEVPLPTFTPIPTESSSPTVTSVELPTDTPSPEPTETPSETPTP